MPEVLKGDRGFEGPEREPCRAVASMSDPMYTFLQRSTQAGRPTFQQLVQSCSPRHALLWQPLNKAACCCQLYERWSDKRCSSLNQVCRQNMPWTLFKLVPLRSRSMWTYQGYTEGDSGHACMTSLQQQVCLSRRSTCLCPH